MRKYLTEAIGTFFLVLAVGLSGNPFAIGLVLAALIYGTLHISGAHFNAAISFAYLIKRKIDFNSFISYLLSQTLGAFAAAGIILFLSDEVLFVEPPTSTHLYQQATVEILLTFILVFTYLNMTLRSSTRSLALKGLAIGLTYSAIIYLGDAISGAGFNPSMSLGVSVIDYFAVKGQSFQYIPLYTAAPIAGSALAAFAYSYLND
jgi:glycerol uptake facilitator-like aquaporin